ncbi:MAG: RNA polymerase Rpb6 [Bacteroidales bacterium]|nr:RNA polymerase Rpb6 [Bacteroidales bacterium]
MDYKKTQADQTTQTRNVNDFSKVTGNFYETVAMLSKRSDQIATDLKQELNKKIEDFAISENGIDDSIENKEQIEVSRFYEQLPKPYLIAIKEYQDDKLLYRNDELGHGNMEAPIQENTDEE